MKIMMRAGFVCGPNSEEIEVELRFGKYRCGEILIDGFDVVTGEPWFKATVVIEGQKPGEGCVFLKGWSENTGIPEALVKAGIVEFTGRIVCTGYCQAEEARLLVEVE